MRQVRWQGKAELFEHILDRWFEGVFAPAQPPFVDRRFADPSAEAAVTSVLSKLKASSASKGEFLIRYHQLMHCCSRMNFGSYMRFLDKVTAKPTLLAAPTALSCRGQAYESLVLEMGRCCLERKRMTPCRTPGCGDRSALEIQLWLRIVHHRPMSFLSSGPLCIS